MTRPAPLPLTLLLLATSGCSDDRPLVVATPWDRASCLAIEAEFRAEGRPTAAPIRWIRLAPRDDPARLLAARSDVDLLLGWPASTLESLRDRAVVAFPDPAPPPGRTHGQTPIDPPSSIADPRLDPLARLAVAHALGQGDGRDGYARLIEQSAQAEAASPPAIPARAGGAALIIASDHVDATTFLGFVAARIADDPASSPAAPPMDPDAIRVAAELIGATAIDAGEELRAAWTAAGQSSDPDAARTALTEPPPWPPASVQRWRDDPGQRPLLDTLASALVEDEEARSWLLESWQRPVRPIDHALIAELADVGGGRLVDGPRVLPWLRAEWTAWARQRYGRIARERGDGGIEAPR